MLAISATDDFSERKPLQERHLFLFYNDLTRRWKVARQHQGPNRRVMLCQVAPEVGAKGLSVLARSPVGWDQAQLVKLLKSRVSYPLR